MTEYVLLNDNDNGAALVQCATMADAEAVGAAAIFSDGGVSAWLVPKRAIEDSEALRERLRDGETTHEIHEATESYKDVSVVSPEDVIPYDLRLSFTPAAIREHFEGDDEDPTASLTDEQLAEVGRTALTDDGLYRAFHEALVWALEESD